jgi:peptidoglycan/xylan/chitin deacetylase (PgdA/CDA1 family)
MSDVLVLCYHAVSERWPSSLAVTPQALEEQLTSLVRRGYRGATFEQAVTAPLAPRTVAVTFDDAYRSVLELALPILERLRLPGSIYVPTDWVGREEPMTWPGIEEWAGGPHAGELRCLDWDGLRTLADAGWEVGSHTRTHPRLTTLADAALTEELAASGAAVEAGIGRPCTTIAYPYGDVDARVVRAAREAGYRAGAALPSGMHRRSTLAWPRVGVYPIDDRRRFGLKASRTVRALRLIAARNPRAPG